MRQLLIRFTVMACACVAALPMQLSGGHSAADHHDYDQRDRIVELFGSAREAEQKQDFAAAVGFYAEILKVDPSLAEVFSNEGLALYRLGRDAQAISALEKAAALKPALLAPHVFAGLAYLRTGAPEKAIAPFKAALAIEPDQQEARLGLADAYALTKQFFAAVQVYQQVLARDPESEEASYRLASTYTEWGEFIGLRVKSSATPYGALVTSEIEGIVRPDRAEGSYREALDLYPRSVELRLAFGYFLLSRPSAQNVSDARQQFEQAKLLTPGSLDVEAAFGRLALASGDLPSYARPSKEMHDAQQSSRLSRNKGVLYAISALHLGQYDEALPILAKQPATDTRSQYWLSEACRDLARQTVDDSVTRHPQSWHSHLLLANMALQKNDYESARHEYHAALELNKQDAEVRLLYIRFLETAHDEAQALIEAKQAVADFPSHPGLTFHLAKLELDSGDAEAAQAHFAQSLDGDPKNVFAAVGLADSYAALNKTSSAIQEITRVLSTDTDGSLHYRLAHWYQKSGQPREAAAAFAETKRMQLAANMAATERFAHKINSSNGAR